MVGMQAGRPHHNARPRELRFFEETWGISVVELRVFAGARVFASEPRTLNPRDELRIFEELPGFSWIELRIFAERRGFLRLDGRRDARTTTTIASCASSLAPGF